MNRIEQIIGEIEEFVESCKSYPLSSSKIIVPKEELSEMLVDLRMAIPDEVSQCQKIISNQSAILTDAKTRADDLIAKANQETEKLVDEHAIMQRAYATANRLTEDAKIQAQGIVDSAAQEADSIRLGAIRYTDDMLRSLQTIIGHALDTSKSRYDALQADLQSSLDIVSSNRKELAQGMPKDDGIDIPQ